MLTLAAIVVAAGLAVALVVRTGGEGRQSSVLGGEGSGTVAVSPSLVEPRLPGSTLTPSTPDPSEVPGNEARQPAREAPHDVSSEGLGITLGAVGELYPGHQVELEVTYVNPYSFPIAIDTVSVNATGTSRCPGRHLRSTSTPDLRLPSDSSVASTIEVGMRRSAPDACQGVRFTLRVGATAVQL